VQWMTAGSGVLHNEYHDEEFARAGGTLHMIQIWVNLPKIHKLAAPKYQALTNDSIRTVALDGGKGAVRVISGSFEETAGPASTFSPAHMLDVRLNAGGRVRLPTPKDYNTALLVLGGKVTANGSKPVSAGEFILFRNDGDEVSVESLEDSIVMFLSGAPIDEPLVHYGPFVMNSVDEINEAIDDFNSGKFGEIAN
jgi:quercetin 2,3-dioxygenase